MNFQFLLRHSRYSARITLWELVAKHIYHFYDKCPAQLASTNRERTTTNAATHSTKVTTPPRPTPKKTTSPYTNQHSALYLSSPETKEGATCSLQQRQEPPCPRYQQNKSPGMVQQPQNLYHCLFSQSRSSKVVVAQKLW
jgi:hypothetical protein